MRADAVAQIGHDRVARWSCIGEDVEMVEPEVGQHFAQLCAGVHGAGDLGCPQFDQNALRWAESDGVVAALVRVILEQFARLHGQRGIEGQAFLQFGVVDGLGAYLFP